MASRPSGTEINDGHYLEALDRANTLSIMIDQLLEDHPVVAEHPEVKDAYEAASIAIGALYQVIGRRLHAAVSRE